MMLACSLLQPIIRTSRSGAKLRILCRTSDYDVSLVHYLSNTEHPRHEHSQAQLTFLLCGGFADQREGRETDPAGARHGFRPQGARHSCRFGKSGALILSVNFRSGREPALAANAWQPSSPRMSALYALLFSNSAPPRDVIDDLIAAAGLTDGDGAACPTGLPPRWLCLALEQVMDDPTVEIAAIAQSAGVHRVRLSREFQKYFGISPTHFRLHCKAAIAMRHLIEGGEALASAAVAAGFADQAHWTRTSRAAVGIGPGRLRRLLTAG